MNINVHIERLILEGIDVSHRERPFLQAAVEGELARLLEADGAGTGLMAGGAVRSISGGDIQLTGRNDPTDLGQQIARSVYGGIGK